MGGMIINTFRENGFISVKHFLYPLIFPYIDEMESNIML